MTIERFGIPAKGKSNLREMFEAFREYVKKTVEAKGEELSPGWYPEKHPERWAHRPDLLKAFGIEPPKPSSED
jgi:hypothetical protein